MEIPLRVMKTARWINAYLEEPWRNKSENFDYLNGNKVFGKSAFFLAEH